MTLSRREVLRGLFGATGLATLAALAPGRAQAATGAGALLLLTSAQGDPLNGNAPGMYEDPRLLHPDDPALAPTPLLLGTETVTAARVFGGLDAEVRARLCFIHHGTRSATHPEHRQVMSLQGVTRGGESLPSLIARRLQPRLLTTQVQPASLDDNGIFFAGAPLPRLTPLGLRALLATPEGPLLKLRALRDRHLDRLYALARRGGGPAQLGRLDELARSHAELRGLADGALALLDGIRANDTAGQLRAAVALLVLNVTPVVTASLPFGSDNHYDPGLVREAHEHQSAVGHLSQLFTLLRDAGLFDRVTVALVNVFGRTLLPKAQPGRDHYGDHSVALLCGPRVRGGVVGGLDRDRLRALPIDSRSGAGQAGGDVPFEDTLASVGKTVGAAVGLLDADIAQDIGAGRVLAGALRP